MVFARTVLCSLAMCCVVPLAGAAPYVPGDGKQVLETLPAKTASGQREMARLRAQLQDNANDLGVAAPLARQYIEASRIDGDPRYLGYAQSVLQPWWGMQKPPEEALLLRATILQSTHRFKEALDDLDALLARNRDQGQAWLTRATILTVLGKHDDAKKSCSHLYRLAGELVTATCMASVGSLSGDGPASYRTLSHALQNHPSAPVEMQTWILTLLGEIAVRLGDERSAENHFRKAIALAPPDGYLLGAYADFLLDHQRPEEVVDLLESKTRNDALLLRYALALKAQHSPRAANQIEILRQRFAAAALRGDTVHQREQARFELHLLEDPGRALATARLNWEVQKEPADLRVLLEAARTAHDQATLDMAMEWIRKTGYQDRTLSPLLDETREKA